MTAERTLYYANGSIPSWRVLLALHSKGLAFTGQRLRLMGGERETRRPEFLAINARGHTPVLIDDGVTINESFAILHWLELRHPATPLLPADPQALGRALARAHEAETFAAAYEPIEQMFVVGPGDADAPLRERLAAALAAVAWELGLWEARAAAGPFIAGDMFTLADCSFYPTIAYMRRRGLSLAEHPRLEDYRRRVEALPAAVAAYPVGWSPERTGKPDLFALARRAVADA